MLKINVLIKDLPNSQSPRLHPTVDGKVVLHQYHQLVLEAFCEDLGAKLNDSRCIECFQSFIKEVVSK
jgi:hypothetical protein